MSENADLVEEDQDGTPPDPPDAWELHLYVVGQSPESLRALNNLKQLCKTHLPGSTIQVIDLKQRPELASEHQILAVPTLVRRSPQPVRMVIGDLSNETDVLVGLGLRGHDP